MVNPKHSGFGKKGKKQAIVIEKKGDEEQELAIWHETAPKKKAGSVWGWYEEFAIEWSETLITRKKQPR